MTINDQRVEYLGDHERLYSSSMRNVGTNAEVDHRTASVYGRRGAIGHFGVNEVLLVFVIL